jgi:hypothetical protein
MQMMVPTQNVRTPVSQVPGVGKKDALYLWSAARFLSGATAGSFINIFQASQGQQPAQGFPALTSRETSLTQNPGQVPLDQRWECFDLGVEFIGGGTSTSPPLAATEVPVTIAQAAQLYSKLQLELVRGQTQAIQLGPCSLYPGGTGLTSVENEADALTASAAFNGFASIGARRRLGRSLVLNPGDTWFMKLVVADADGIAAALGTNGFVDVRVSMWMYRDLGLSG